jgi:hypothetical protein
VIRFTWAARLLTETEGTGGGFLDDGSAFGAYSRLNLYAAAKRAAALASSVLSTIHDGSLSNQKGKPVKIRLPKLAG